MATIKIVSNYIENIEASDVQVKYSANGLRILRYYIDLSQKELQVHKQRGAPEIYLLQQKVNELLINWDQKVVEYRQKKSIIAAKKVAEQLTSEASQKLYNIATILSSALNKNKRFSWHDLKDNSQFKSNSTFTEKQPVWNNEPRPRRPIPHISLFDKIFRRKAKKLEMAALKYQEALVAWQERLEQSESIHNQNLQKWQITKQIFEDKLKQKQQKFLNEQKQKKRVLMPWNKALRTKTANRLSNITH